MHTNNSVIQIMATAIFAASVAMPTSSFAQTYPTRTVKIIVPFGPGGASDTLARLTGQSMERQFKQSFIIENRPGGNTLIGTDVVAKSPADGYTLGVQASSIAGEQVLNKDWTLRLGREVDIISIFAGAGFAVTVSSDTGVKNLKELVEYVKANPGKVNQGQAGAISPDMAILKQRLGIPPVEDILYKSGPLATQAVVANEVQMYGAAAMDVASLAKAGKLRIIAYTEKERHPLIADVPTVAESGVGLNDFEAGFWFTLFGPSNLPADITTKLNAAIQVMTGEQEFNSKATAFGMRVYRLNVQQSRERARSTIQMLERAQAAGIKLR